MRKLVDGLLNESMMDADFIRALIATARAEWEATTPGPWAYEFTGEKDNSWAIGIVVDEEGDLVAGLNEDSENAVIDTICVNDGGDTSSNLADPQWIAHEHERAPQLLDGLEAALERILVLEEDRNEWAKNAANVLKQRMDRDTRIKRLESENKALRRRLGGGLQQNGCMLSGGCSHHDCDNGCQASADEINSAAAPSPLA